MKILFGLWLVGLATTIAGYVVDNKSTVSFVALLVTAKLGWILVCFLPWKFAKTKRHVDSNMIWWLSLATIVMPPAWLWNMIWAVAGPHEAPMTRTGFLAEEERL